LFRIISAFIIDALAPSFGAEKNMGRSVQLVSYSYTPGWIGGLLAIIPAIALIGALAACMDYTCFISEYLNSKSLRLISKRVTLLYHW